ncbi:hypothetical protein B0O99DRAFT_694558 [Bisporella sp. PMI_857]|nr:hypothetical protein B0O99DRAFT_694558 [Bisporella sp. PMI_857]
MKRGAKHLKRIQKFLAAQDTKEPDELDESITSLQFLTRGWTYGTSAFDLMAETGSVYYFHGGGLLELLMISRNFEATNKRDKIYGVLGLARVPTIGTGHIQSTDQSPHFVVDYSHSVSEAYQHVVKYFINRDRNLDILCVLATHRGPTSSDLPSWVPD